MSEPITLYPTLITAYWSECGYRMTREDEHNSFWVLRDPDGLLIDVDQYRHDLESRHNIKLAHEPRT